MNLSFPGLVASPKCFCRALPMRLRHWLEACFLMVLLSHTVKLEGGRPGLSLCFLMKLAGTEAPRSVFHI